MVQGVLSIHLFPFTQSSHTLHTTCKQLHLHLRDRGWAESLRFGRRTIYSAEVMLSPPPDNHLNHNGPAGQDGALPSAEEDSALARETIDDRLESPTVNDADKPGVDPDQQAHERKRRARRLQKRHEIKADLQFMISANREAGGQGVYSGFRFVRAGGNDVSPDEEPYLGAFLPLKVAIKFPRLMAYKTVTYEDVFVNEPLDPATRTVVGPGKFRRYGIVSFMSKVQWLLLWGAYLAGALVALAVIVKAVLWIKRFL